jgi:hypothetical protein
MDVVNVLFVKRILRGEDQRELEFERGPFLARGMGEGESGLWGWRAVQEFWVGEARGSERNGIQEKKGDFDQVNMTGRLKSGIEFFKGM